MTVSAADPASMPESIFLKPDIVRVKYALSSVYWKWYCRDDAVTETSLINFLQQKLPHISIDSWQERLAYGGVYLNARAARKDQTFAPPAMIEYYEPKYDIRKAEAVFPTFKMENIIFEDDYLLAVYKPAGLPSLPAREQNARCLKNQIEDYLGSTKIHMPSRLDTSAQGLILISKSPDMHGPLQRLFEHREIKKTYLLAAADCPTWSSQVVRAAITRSPHHPVLRMPAESGQEAVTHFNRQNTFPTDKDGGDIYIIKAEPMTGRTHQIRVHAASIGIPIVGDNFYGGKAAMELHLLSYGLRFEHPISKKEISLFVPDNLLPEWAVAD